MCFFFNLSSGKTFFFFFLSAKLEKELLTIYFDRRQISWSFSCLYVEYTYYFSSEPWRVLYAVRKFYDWKKKNRFRDFSSARRFTNASSLRQRYRDGGTSSFVFAYNVLSGSSRTSRHTVYNRVIFVLLLLSTIAHSVVLIPLIILNRRVDTHAPRTTIQS